MGREGSVRAESASTRSTPTVEQNQCAAYCTQLGVLYAIGRSDRPPPGRLWSVRQRGAAAALCVAYAAYLLKKGLAGGPGPDEEAAAGPRWEALTGARHALPSSSSVPSIATHRLLLLHHLHRVLLAHHHGVLHLLLHHVPASSSHPAHALAQSIRRCRTEHILHVAQVDVVGRVLLELGHPLSGGRVERVLVLGYFSLIE